MQTSAHLLGFTPPPGRLRLKLLEGPHHWSLFIKPEIALRPAAIVEWLEAWSPLRFEFGSRQVLRADFDPLPAAWRARFGSLELQMADMHPDGTTIVNVAGTHAALVAFGRTLSADAKLDLRQVGESRRDAPLLTRAQDEALRVAVDAGYYQIPRPMTLHQLAAKMGISPASFSERLRRAEGRIILRYAKDGAVTPWDARTIFDVHTPGARDDEERQAADAFEVLP